jgi:hypothetical protein
MSSLPPDAWWPRFWAQAVVLVNAADKTIEDLVGLSRQDTVERYLAQNAKNIEHRTEMLLERARQRLALHESGDLPARAEADWDVVGDLTGGFDYRTTATCPACGESGVLEGGNVTDSQLHTEQVAENDYDMSVDLTVGSDYFSCPRCHLVSDGFELVAQAGLEQEFITDGDPRTTSVTSTATTRSRPPELTKLATDASELDGLPCNARRDVGTQQGDGILRDDAAMDYHDLWRRTSVAEFGGRICDGWASVYTTSTGADPDDLVVVDPGNRFSYTFDLAGSLREDPSTRAPRVIGVWRCSQPGAGVRDRNRMRGFPRPVRHEDDRGHLISCAAGGGYDINLVPMNAALNRGWSQEGARFRAMERLAAAVPGTLFFIRPVYDDDSDRPCRFEVGVQVGTALLVEEFANAPSQTNGIRLAALRHSVAFPLGADLVSGCLDLENATDRLFARGCRSGAASLSRAERCAVAAVTGHVAESVTALLLDAVGWRVVWHHVGPGPHGVDLVLLTPDDNVVAMEVKGTLVPGRIPRLSHRDIAQMSAAWIDKADNPGMAELGLRSADIYGGVVAINFADLTWRAAMMADFAQLRPISDIKELTQLRWLDPLPSPRPDIIDSARNPK